MKTLMDKITHLEEKTDGTVLSFNKLFTTQLDGVCPSLEVEIGELADTDTTRWLTIGSLLVKHNFTPSRELVEVKEAVGAGVYTKGHTVNYRERKLKGIDA